MARIRSQHPGQWTDPEFVSCSPFARLFALGLRNEADDNGIVEWNPVKLKMRLLPADNLDIKALMDELVETNQVWMFEVDGRNYVIIRNFQKFQRPKKPAFLYPIPRTPLPNGYELSDKDSRTQGVLFHTEFPTGGGLKDGKFPTDDGSTPPPVPDRYGTRPSDGRRSVGGVEGINPHGSDSELHPDRGSKGGAGGKVKRNGFQPPTLADVRAYAGEIQSEVNPVTFWNHYQAIGWVVGKARTPMKDWQAAFRGWTSRDRQGEARSA